MGCPSILGCLSKVSPLLDLELLFFNKTKAMINANITDVKITIILNDDAYLSYSTSQFNNVINISCQKETW